MLFQDRVEVAGFLGRFLGLSFLRGRQFGDFVGCLAELFPRGDVLFERLARVALFLQRQLQGAGVFQPFDVQVKLAVLLRVLAAEGFRNGVDGFNDCSQRHNRISLFRTGVPPAGLLPRLATQLFGRQRSPVLIEQVAEFDLVGAPQLGLLLAEHGVLALMALLA